MHKIRNFELNQARLRTLQAQLQPHFLFNALNGIATPVRRDSMESLAFNWIQKVPAEMPA